MTFFGYQRLKVPLPRDALRFARGWSLPIFLQNFNPPVNPDLRASRQRRDPEASANPMNPVKHKFCEHPVEYPWTSFLPFLSDRRTRLKKDIALEWFDSMGDFELEHHREQNFDDIQRYRFEYDV
jgi:hypothetical protein